MIPFRSGGKTRLPREVRRPLALAMLEDVVAAASPVGEVRVVTSDIDASDAVRAVGASVVADPGGGQGPAVALGLRDSTGPCLVVNADLPLATATAVRRLAAAAPGLVAAADGTTNALALPDVSWFSPLFGPGSARRFAERGFGTLVIPELEHDVDTLDDLRDVATRAETLGPRTTLVVDHHRVLTGAR